MRRLAALVAAAFLVLLAGCSDDDLEGTQAELRDAILEVCSTEVAQEEIALDSGYAPLRELSEESLVLRCPDRPKQSAVYARFATEEKLQAALQSSSAPAPFPVSFCVADLEVFNLVLDAAEAPDATAALCAGQGGHLQQVFRPTAKPAKPAN